MTGFYVALNEDNGAGMAGFSPEAVLRTLSGLQVVQGGCESVAPVSAAPPGRHAGTVAGPLKRKKPIRQDGLFTCLMPGSSLLSHGETPHYHRRYGVSLLSSAWGQVGPPRYRRQANSVFQHVSRTHRLICITLKIFSQIRQNSFGVVRLSLTVH